MNEIIDGGGETTPIEFNDIKINVAGTEPVRTIREKDWYRLLRMIAIDHHYTLTLFHEVANVSKIKFEDVLKEIAEDFEVPYEKLRDVKFARFE